MLVSRLAKKRMVNNMHYNGCVNSFGNNNMIICIREFGTPKSRQSINRVRHRRRVNWRKQLNITPTIYVACTNCNAPVKRYRMYNSFIF